MTQEELNKVLEKHKHWLIEDCEGWVNMRADLSYADLSCADLSCAKLSDANLRGVNLGRAYLSCANLGRADLRGADLSCADLSYANLRGANNVPFIPYSCPDFGIFVGYKKQVVISLSWKYQRMPGDYLLQAGSADATRQRCFGY